jgi:hypothetical protein
MKRTKQVVVGFCIVVVGMAMAYAFDPPFVRCAVNCENVGRSCNPGDPSQVCTIFYMSDPCPEGCAVSPPTFCQCF